MEEKTVPEMKGTKYRKSFSTKGGFTLVELIVVIVIILVLAAVMVPSLLKWVDKAKRARTLEEAGTAVMMTQLLIADAYMADAGTTIELSEIKRQSSVPGQVTGYEVDGELNLIHLTYQNEWYTVVYCRNYALPCPEASHTRLYNFLDTSGAGGNPSGGETETGGSEPSSFPVDIVKGNVWPSEDTFGGNTHSTVTLKDTGIFKHGDSYYIATGNLTIKYDQAMDGPDAVLKDTDNNDHNKLIRLTQTVISLSDEMNVQKGDIVKASDGKWYVALKDSDTAPSPEKDKNEKQWYAIPD